MKYITQIMAIAFAMIFFQEVAHAGVVYAPSQKMLAISNYCSSSDGGKLSQDLRRVDPNVRKIIQAVSVDACTVNQHYNIIQSFLSDCPSLNVLKITQSPGVTLAIDPSYLASPSKNTPHLKGYVVMTKSTDEVALKTLGAFQFHATLTQGGIHLDDENQAKLFAHFAPQQSLESFSLSFGKDIPMDALLDAINQAKNINFRSGSHAEFAFDSPGQEANTLVQNAIRPAQWGPVSIPSVAPLIENQPAYPGADEMQPMQSMQPMTPQMPGS